MLPDAEALGHVDEQAQVDAVAVDEGHLLEHLPAGGALAGQGLDQRRQLGEEQGDEGAGHQLGHPAPFARRGRRGAGGRSP